MNLVHGRRNWFCNDFFNFSYQDSENVATIYCKDIPKVSKDFLKEVVGNNDNDENREVKPRRCTCAFIAGSINIAPKHPVVNLKVLQIKNVNKILLKIKLR